MGDIIDFPRSNNSTNINIEQVDVSFKRSSGISMGGGGGDMEARIAKLESDVGHIQTDVKEIKGDIRDIKSDMKTDFRLLFGALIVATLGLAAIIAKGFHWL